MILENIFSARYIYIYFIQFPQSELHFSISTCWRTLRRVEEEMRSQSGSSGATSWTSSSPWSGTSNSASAVPNYRSTQRGHCSKSANTYLDWYDAPHHRQVGQAHWYRSSEGPNMVEPTTGRSSEGSNMVESTTGRSSEGSNMVEPTTGIGLVKVPIWWNLPLVGLVKVPIWWNLPLV